MKNLALIISTILLCANSFAIEHPLYPEDGSSQMNYWYYSGGTTGPRIKKEIIQNIESAFRSEGVEPVVFANYAWMQDILFFDEVGNFVELANLPINEEYFSGLTMGVFESYGWSSGDLTRISDEDFSNYDKKVQSLSIAFLEGGATITGKFSNGDSYLITYESRFKGMAAAYRDLIDQNASKEIIHNYLATDLKLKSENLIFLPTATGYEHLDLFLKALPGGVLLIDDPFKRLEVAKQALKANETDTLKNILRYEDGSNYVYKKKFYRKKIKLIEAILAKKFKIIPISGRFHEYFTNLHGVTSAQEYINFFNGVSGLNGEGKAFYITNMAENAPELEEYWTSSLEDLGFNKEHIYFPGEYSNGSGLDCMGSPSL